MDVTQQQAGLVLQQASLRFPLLRVPEAAQFLHRNTTCPGFHQALEGLSVLSADIAFPSPPLPRAKSGDC